MPIYYYKASSHIAGSLPFCLVKYIGYKVQGLAWMDMEGQTENRLMDGWLEGRLDGCSKTYFKDC